MDSLEEEEEERTTLLFFNSSGILGVLAEMLSDQRASSKLKMLLLPSLVVFYDFIRSIYCPSGRPAGQGEEDVTG